MATRDLSLFRPQRNRCFQTQQHGGHTQPSHSSEGVGSTFGADMMRSTSGEDTMVGSGAANIAYPPSISSSLSAPAGRRTAILIDGQPVPVSVVRRLTELEVELVKAKREAADLAARIERQDSRRVRSPALAIGAACAANSPFAPPSAELNSLRAENQRLTEELTSLRRELEERERVLEDGEAALEGRREQVEALANRAQHDRLLAEDLLKEVETHRREFNMREKALTSREAELEEREQEFEELEKRASTLSREQEDFKKEKARVLKKMSELQAEARSLARERTRLQQTEIELGELRARLSQQLHASQSPPSADEASSRGKGDSNDGGHSATMELAVFIPDEIIETHETLRSQLHDALKVQEVLRQQLAAAQRAMSPSPPRPPQRGRKRSATSSDSNRPRSSSADSKRRVSSASPSTPEDRGGEEESPPPSPRKRKVSSPSPAPTASPRRSSPGVARGGGSRRRAAQVKAEPPPNESAATAAPKSRSRAVAPVEASSKVRATRGGRVGSRGAQSDSETGSLSRARKRQPTSGLAAQSPSRRHPDPPLLEFPQGGSPAKRRQVATATESSSQEDKPAPPRSRRKAPPATAKEQPGRPPRAPQKL